jgi:hypothetical protein
MALKAAMVLAVISIVLLVLYGADVAVSMSNTDNEGFLPLNDMQRGMGLGGPAILLPIVAFFIVRRINHSFRNFNYNGWFSNDWNTSSRRSGKKSSNVICTSNNSTCTRCN